MRRTATAVTIVIAALTTAGLATPASGSAHAAKPKAKPGQYYATSSHTGYPGFVLNKKRTAISGVVATAPIAPKCQATLTSGYAVANAGAKVKNDHFVESSTAYGGLKVKVTFQGHWTSPTVVHGETVVTYKSAKYKKCDATVRFTSAWNKPA